MVSLAAGRNLTPRFKLLRRFAQGGTGEVWLVEDEELSERVVAKIVPEDAPSAHVELLKHEYRSARKLVHPNIARIHDFHRAGDLSFVTMEYVDGVGLGIFEGRRLDELLPIIVSLADALDYAHRQGIVHRDLKPSNVIVDASGVPHLVDFGIAGLLENTEGSLRLSGGGTRAYSSPEQLRGSDPAVADDVYGFGALFYRLLTERSPGDPLLFPDSVPERVRSLLDSLLSPEPSRRPASMAEVRRELEALRSPKIAPEIVPPLRIPEPRAPFPARARSGNGVGWKTISAFVVVLSAAVAVFALLPGWVENLSAPVPPPTAAETKEPVPAPGEAVDLRELAREKTNAENAEARASRSREALEARNAARWGGERYREALSRIAEGDALLATRDYRQATGKFEEAVRGFSTVEARTQEVFAEAVANGGRALESGLSSEARERFSLALQIDPSSEAARRGLARARSLDEVLALVAAGEERERRGDLAAAAERFRKAVSLDPLSKPAQSGLARVDAKAVEQAFAASMSRALAALGREDYASAREALEHAKSIRPNAPEIEDRLAQVEEGLRSSTIAGHRDRARNFEEREQWREAVEEYEAILALDPTVRFAQEGKKATEARALLQDRLDFQIANSGRLSDGNALREASLLLDEARGVDPSGPRHRTRVAKLEALVASYSAPVTIDFLSDNLTEITLTKVGRLGKFERRSLELRPGRYTVVGSRPGYRDVRREVVVEAGKAPEPFLVRCEEKI